MKQMKHFVECKCLVLILSEKIRDGMYSSSQEYKKRLAQNDGGSVLIRMPTACIIVIFPTLKWHFSVKWFIALLSGVLLKPNPSFAFFPQYIVLLSDNLIKASCLPFKTISVSLRGTLDSVSLTYYSDDLP